MSILSSVKQVYLNLPPEIKAGVGMLVVSGTVGLSISGVILVKEKLEEMEKRSIEKLAAAVAAKMSATTKPAQKFCLNCGTPVPYWWAYCKKCHTNHVKK